MLNDANRGFIVIGNYETAEDSEGRPVSLSTGKHNSDFHREMLMLAFARKLPVVESPMIDTAVFTGTREDLENMRTATNGIYSYALTDHHGYARMVTNEVQHAAEILAHRQMGTPLPPNAPKFN